MIQVLFVCLGNICRSPMAEAIFRDLVKKRGLENMITVDSAGTSNWHEGSIPHEGTRQKLDEAGISYAGMKARQIDQDDFHTYDYIIAMDDNNINDIRETFTIPEDVVVKKLLDFVDNPKETNVPDPYYTGDFDYTYELVSEACEQLLETIVKNMNN